MAGLLSPGAETEGVNGSEEVTPPPLGEWGPTRGDPLPRAI